MTAFYINTHFNLIFKTELFFNNTNQITNIKSLSIDAKDDGYPKPKIMICIEQLTNILNFW